MRSTPRCSPPCATRAGERFEPRHALLGEAIVDDLLPGERTALHRRIADLLAAGTDDDGEPARIAGEIAHHRWEAHDTELAVAASVRAAVAAADARAYAEADVHWTRALEAWPAEGEVEGFDHPAALLEAGEVTSNLGHRGRGVDLASRAIELIDPRTDPMRAALAHQQLGLQLNTVDSHAASFNIAQAARLIPAVDAPPVAARVLVVRAVDLSWRLQLDRAEPIARRALELDARHEFAEVEPVALGVLGWCHLGRSEHAAAVEVMTRLFELAERVDGRRVMVYAGHAVSAGLNSTGLWSQALQYLDRYEARMTELGVGRSWGWWMHDARAAALLGLGRWQEAEIGGGLPACGA